MPAASCARSSSCRQSPDRLPSERRAGTTAPPPAPPWHRLGTAHRIEHPHRDLPVDTCFVSIDSAPEHLTARPRLADDDIWPYNGCHGYRTRRVSVLMITVVGTSTITGGRTKRWRIGRRRKCTVWFLRWRSPARGRDADRSWTRGNLTDEISKPHPSSSSITKTETTETTLAYPAPENVQPTESTSLEAIQSSGGRVGDGRPTSV